MKDKKAPKLILANGESYIDSFKKRGSGREPDFPYEYEEARDRSLGWIESLEETVLNIDESKCNKDSFVFGLTLNEAFGAKSYFPKKIIHEANVEFIGSKSIDTEEVSRKFIYARGSLDSLERLKSTLNQKESSLTKNWKNDLRKLENISLDNFDNTFEGFEKKWSSGRVEIILHPMGGYSDEVEQKLLSILQSGKFDEDLLRVSNYGKNELKFLSAYLTKKQLLSLKGFNALRTIHPLGGYKIPSMRNASRGHQHPVLSHLGGRSTAKVGMFDGGIDPGHPLLKGHTKDNVLTNAKKDLDKYISHGNSVAGAMLYGDLSKYGAGASLPPPRVFVESFQVFPLENERDIDLYEVIDHIEEVVASREDIKVYNISFGPDGPIYNDNIQRFTYALDRLAHEYKVLFVVAVGNDGLEGEPFNRIQSPSDIINGLGVGSYSYRREGDSEEFQKVRAPYSCVGPGREGAQTKPDLVAFGGCDHTPMHLIGEDHSHRVHNMGTSFSTPLVSSLATELMGRCQQFKAITARTLISHRSSHPNKKPCIELGNGFAPKNFDDLVECTDDSYTVVFQSSLMPGKFAKLPIPLPDLTGVKGKVSVKWTVGILSTSDLKNSEEYSTVSIEDVFYPHSSKFKLTRDKPRGKKESKTLDIIVDKGEIDDLLASGWKISSVPVTENPKSLYLSEEERKADLKWDATFTRSTTKYAKSFYEPFIALHAMERNVLTDSHELVHYSVTATVEIKKYEGDLYNDIQKVYTKLNPVEVRAVNEVVVSVR